MSSPVISPVASEAASPTSPNPAARAKKSPFVSIKAAKPEEAPHYVKHPWEDEPVPKPAEKSHFWQPKPDHFNGKLGFARGTLFRRPERSYVDGEFKHTRDLENSNTNEQVEYYHRDAFGRVTYRKRDLVNYLSPTDVAPRRLMVQASPDVYKNQPAGDWRRVKLKGNAPFVLRISEWALAPSNKGQDNKRSFWGILYMCLRVILVVPIILVTLSLPLDKVWEPVEFKDTYHEVYNYCWDYPKHARNALDQRPPRNNSSTGSQQPATGLASNKMLPISSQPRMLRPRQLVVLKDGEWQLDPNPSRRVAYIFISYTTAHFNIYTDESARVAVETLAQKLAVENQVQAYWMDFRCAAPELGELRDSDVNRLCDVIRGARRICVVLPDLSSTSKHEWGARMWTLPEALLSSKEELLFCSPHQEPQLLSKLDMTDEVWEDGESTEHGDNQVTRLLAEHYSNVVELSRLELFTLALTALTRRQQKRRFTGSDEAVALMGLLHYRIDVDPTDKPFQALARLSFANDTDRLIERMVCMFPHHRPGENFKSEEENLFVSLTARDQFGCNLWDIEPLCQVAGVGVASSELILDSCRGISIRWKQFPKMQYRRAEGLRQTISELVLRSGASWTAAGLSLIAIYGGQLYQQYLLPPNERTINYDEFSRLVGLIFFGTLALIAGILLALFAPIAVRRLYGGRVMQSAPWLIGFEGTMPASKLETIVFGNDESRLTYEASSTPYCVRDPNERLGLEPAWISDPANNPRPEVPRGQRFFTLVDTGNLTISIFTAVRPPSVALICGKEGGMLRTVLCHYERSNNSFYKESVMRMDSLTLNQAKSLSWVKLNVGLADF
ncbi:MAG: hypothetical protein M1829_003454 [Trizodia sp. TS-e1964]|nr:MAG: hypothetical protein M1829_003454 [Trizodia sp. TS-e1964]